MLRPTRRRFLRGTSALAAAAAVSSPSVLRGQAALPRVTYVTFATGYNVVLNEYMA